MLLISEMELPKGQDESAFVAFMRDEYMPAVETGGPTRIGMTEGVRLLQGATPETSRRFLWLVEWNGLEHEQAGSFHVDDETARKFAEYGAGRNPHAAWQEVGSNERSGAAD
jgi:hypothetical protein